MPLKMTAEKRQKKETYRMDILGISKNVGFKNDLVQLYIQKS